MVTDMLIDVVPDYTAGVPQPIDAIANVVAKMVSDVINKSNSLLRNVRFYKIRSLGVEVPHSTFSSVSSNFCRDDRV